MKPIIGYAKKNIKRTHAFQLIKSVRFYKKEEKRLDKLLQDEKASCHKICYYRPKKEHQLIDMLSMIQITLRPEERFQSWIDTGLFVSSTDRIVDNMPPDYELIVNNSLYDILQTFNQTTSKSTKEICLLLEAVIKYVDKICFEIEDYLKKEESSNLRKSLYYFDRMKNASAESLEEALQRILFWSSLFWQSRHRLIGLGRLDMLLKDVPSGDNEEDTIQIIIDFYKAIHRYYAYKSNEVAMGDTGQIIICGGVNPDGSYFCNKLSYLFIKAIIACKLPDPKILLRVSNNMPDELLHLALECISTGIGCPLLSNDDVVIPSLEAFGYTHEDACNYVTSACWEPLVYGKSLEQNNLDTLNFAAGIVKMYQDASFISCSSFDEVFRLYKNIIAKQIEKCLISINNIKWEKNPLMSLFNKSCRLSDKDIAQGGSTYNNYGVLSVGLANAVDSLCNIKKYVFEEKKYKLDELVLGAKCNFKNDSEMQNCLLEGRCFGRDDEDALYITLEISEYVNDIFSKYRNLYRGKVKWGLSAPGYVEQGFNVGATLDGRCEGSPLAVHISASQGTAYTELMNFAGRLNYSGNRSNGNVVDFFVSPDFINKNFDKFFLFLKASINVGFFQMQMNVVSSKTLIAAKDNPEMFPDLIVRVWGFSAYFNDLPESYQNVLIERAIESER